MTRGVLHRVPAEWLARLALLLVLTTWAGAADARKVALVIGNGTYATLAPLANPPRDARLVGQAFLQAGFERVEMRTDLDAADFKASLARFKSLAKGAETAVIYFAGHGVEVNGQNWLLPTGTRIAGSGGVAAQAVSMESMLEALGGASGLRVLIIDACRTDPFARRPRDAERQAASKRVVVRGLAAAESTNVLVFYAAKAGTSAFDGIGENSPFAAALAHRIPSPGVDVRRLFGQVRDDVLRETDRLQEPFTYGSAPANSAYFVPAKPEIVLADADDLGWSRASSLDDEAAHAAYLRLFPVGRHWVDAGARYARLRAQRIRKGPVGFGGRAIHVAATGRADFRTLAQALSIVRDGDRILLGPGLHRMPAVTVSKRIAIGALAGPRSRTVIAGDDDRAQVDRLITVADGGSLRIDGLSVRCLCTNAFFVTTGELTLYNVEVVQQSTNPMFNQALSMATDATATLIDSSFKGVVNSISAGGIEVVAVGNDIALPFSGDPERGYFVDNRMGGPAHHVANFSGDGRMLILGNRIDARGLTRKNAFDPFVLFFLRRSFGRIDVVNNQIQPPPAFTDQNWLDCTDSVTCNFAQAGNDIVRAGRPAPASGRRRATRR